MSTRQLARTVLDGQMISFFFEGGERVSGYLSGQDDYHWLVMRPTAEIVLVHKGSVPRIELGAESTYNKEPLHDELERTIGPFRRFVETEIFGRKDKNVDDARTQDGMGV